MVAQEQEIAEMMQGYATQAVALAREFNITLDYSENSLQQVEGLLNQLHDELNQWSMGKPAPEPEPTQQQVDEMSRRWGAYLVEEVRRRYGGEGTSERYPGGGLLNVSREVG